MLKFILGNQLPIRKTLYHYDSTVCILSPNRKNFSIIFVSLYGWPEHFSNFSRVINCKSQKYINFFFKHRAFNQFLLCFVALAVLFVVHAVCQFSKYFKKKKYSSWFLNCTYPFLRSVFLSNL